jgi:hypothetical protein
MDSSNVIEKPDRDYTIITIHNLSLEQLLSVRKALIENGVEEKGTGIWAIDKWIAYKQIKK